MTRQRGFLLIELGIGLFVCSLLFLAAGRLMRQSVRAEKRVEERWGALLACRTVLELSCSTGARIDTQLVCATGTVRAWSTIDRLSTGELIIRAYSTHPEEGRSGAKLTRLIWPGASNAVQERDEP